ncbi:MAG: hypothetical protein ACP5I1_14760, partial [Candidatus Hinthialibacter sp.]
DLTGDDYTDDTAGRRDFIKDYVGSLSDLLPSYAFLDTNASNDPAYILPAEGNSYRNEFLLDLNGGADPDAFIDKTGRTTVLYADRVPTPSEVQERIGPDSEEILSFTDYISRLPGANETWGQEVTDLTRGVGDGFVTAFSSLPDWFDKTREDLETVLIETTDVITHAGMSWLAEGRQAVLDALGVLEEGQEFSTDFVKTELETFAAAIEQGFVDIEDMITEFFDEIPDAFDDFSEYLSNQFEAWGLKIEEDLSEAALEASDAIQDFVQEFSERAEEYLEEQFDEIGDVVTEGFLNATGAISDAANYLNDALTAFGNEVQTFFAVGFITGNDENRSVVLSLGGDDVAIEEYSSDTSKIRLYQTGGSGELIFDKPIDSLEIHLGMGDDTIQVNDLGAIDCSLSIYGGYETNASFVDGQDAVIFAHTNDFEGNNVNVEAETITVDSSVILRTGKSNSTSGNIEFSGETITIQNHAQLITLGEGETGSPGDITLTAKVTDISGFSPVDVFPASDVKIDVMTGAEIQGGVITLTADRTSMLGSPLTVVAVQSKTATINITGAVIEGTEVTIKAVTEDEKPLEGDGVSYFNNYLINPLLDYTDILGTALGSIPVLGAALQAVSVSIRSAESYVTLDGATITSSGNVTINAKTSVESEASAGGGLDLRQGGRAGSTGSQLASSAPFAVSYSEANAIAKTELKGGATITAGGTTDVGSDAANTTTAESYTAVNSSPGKSSQKVNTSVGGVSVAVTNSSTTSNTIVGEG